MPRPIWSGSISFGLVNVPVKLYTAQSPKDVRFNQLHAPDNSRIRQKRFCEEEDREVPYDEIVKGYEVAPGQYVVIEPSELDGLDPEATHTIDIEEFIHLDQIDPIFYERAYYLAPDGRAGKAYRILADALAESGKVALARFVMRTKQYLAAIRVADGVMVLSTMLFADEVVDPEGLDVPSLEDVEVSEKEIKMAQQLIDTLTADDFEPDKYHDEHREKVLDLIEKKAAGEIVTPALPEKEPTRVTDLLAALEASVASAREAKQQKAG